MTLLEVDAMDQEQFERALNAAGQLGIQRVVISSTDLSSEEIAELAHDLMQRNDSSVFFDEPGRRAIVEVHELDFPEGRQRQLSIVSVPTDYGRLPFPIVAREVSAQTTASDSRRRRSGDLFLGLLLPRDLREIAIGDLNQEYEIRKARFGRGWAIAYYCRDLYEWIPEGMKLRFQAVVAFLLGRFIGR